jgi:hypothetical protein
MATQKDFIVKNGLQVKGGNIVTSDGSLSIVDQISGDTGQLTITNGQQGNSFMRMGMIGGGDANSFIRTDRTLEFHIGQSATSATPSAFIDTSHNLNIKGNFQIDGVNRIVGTPSYTEFRNPQGVTKLWLGGGSDGTSDPSAYVNGNNFYIRDFNSTVNSVFSSSGLDIKRGDLKLNATTVIDSSRNLQNIGTITSGAITTSNRLTVNAGHTTTRLNLVYDDRTGITDDGNLLAWVSEPGISYEDAGIGANINPSGQYYGRYVDDGYGVYARFRKSNGNFEVWNTQGTSGSTNQQGTARLVLGASGVLNLPTGSLNIRGTEVISGGRNLVNIGTISNSAFTIPNSIGTAGQVLKVPSTGTTLEWGADTGLISGITNFADNRLLTASGSSTINGETNLSFNGSTLTVNADADFNGANADLQWDSSADSLIFNDNAKAIFGTGSDLSIFHDGNHSYITDSGTGDLLINATNLRLRNVGGVNMLYGQAGGWVKIYFNGSEKFETTNTGVNITGTVTSDGLTVDGNINLGDNNSLFLGDSNDLRIYHDSGSSLIRNSTGDLYIQDDNGNIYIRPKSGQDGLIAVADGAVTLHHSGNAKLATTSSGINVTGGIKLSDNNYLTWANSNTRMVGQSGYLQFQIASSDSMRLTPTGLGIGLTNPSEKLEVLGKIKASGQIRSSSYLESFPSFSFDNDTDTGMYRASENALAFATGGTERWRITSTGTLQGNNATATFNYTGDAIAIKSLADGTTPVGITFTSQGASGTQIGHVRYTHRDASSYDSNESFTIGGTESTTTILADGKLMFKEGLYVKPSSGTGAGTKIIDSSRNLTNIGTISSGAITSSGTISSGVITATKQITADTIYFPLTVAGIDAGNTVNQTTASGIGIEFKLAGNNSAGDSLTGASIVARREMSSDSDSSTGLSFNVSQNNPTLDEALRLNHDQNATFAGKVGIGMTPTEMLDITSASGDARIRLDAPSGSDTEIKFFNAGVAQYTIGHDDATDNFVIGGANVDAELVSISKSGNATFNGAVEVIGNLDGTTADFGGAVSVDSLKQGLTTVIDSSRNLTNIGTISSGAITSSVGTNKKLRTLALDHQTIANEGVGISFSRTTSDAPLMAVGVLDSDKLSLMSRSGIVFATGGTNNYAYTSEVGRFDNAGNFLVGKNSAAGASTVGAEMRPDGDLISTRASAQPLTLNRTTSNGTIAQFRKDNSTVGIIGTGGSGGLYIHSPYGSDSGIVFASEIVAPCTSTGAFEDGVQNLGYSTARWKNLYLSNAVKNESGALAVSSGGGGQLLLQASAELTFTANASERGRFDTSGNFLCGTTDSQIYDDNTDETGIVAGGSIGQLQISTNNNTSLYLNRQNANGRIIDFRINGSRKGSIGTASDDLNINGGTNHSGIRFQATGLYPLYNGNSADGTIDLGATGQRFKDLYLSGTARSNTVSINGTTVINASRGATNLTSVSSSYYTDGYVTWTAAQFNRDGANVEFQWSPSNSSTGVRIGGNGSNPIVLNAYTGTISSGAISTTEKITVTNANFDNHIAFVRGSANMGLSPSGNELLVIGGGFAPNSNNSYSLGRSDKIWVNVFAYNYKIGGTTIINSSRNLLNIGTISSGAITSTGKLTLNDASVGGWIQSNTSVRIDIDNDNNQTDRGFIVSKNNGATDLFTIFENGNATFAGNISSGSITSSSTIGNRSTNIGQQLEKGNSTYATLRFDADNWRVYAGGTGSIGTIAEFNEAGNVNINNGALQMGATTVITSSRNLTNIGTISGTGISTGANLIDLFNNQNGVNELRLDNNRQDLGNVPVSKVSGRNSVEVANMTFYRGSGGASGFIRFQNKPTNASSLTDVFQVGNGSTVGYGVDILAGGLRINGTTVIDSSRNLTNLNSITLNGSLGTWSVNSEGARMNFGRGSANYIDAVHENGYLVFQTSNGETALTLDASQNATFAGIVSNDAIRASDLGSNSHNLSISGTSSPWSATNRATIHLDGVSSSLIGFRHGNANKGYIFATGSVMEFLSYGSVALLANASGSVYGKLSASGIWNVSGSYALGGTTVIDSSRNLTNIGTISSGNATINGSLLGRGFRTGSRGEFHLNSAGSSHTSEIFFGYGDGYTDANIRWGISDRGNDDKLIFYKGPAHGGFANVMYLHAGDNSMVVSGNISTAQYRISGTTVIDSSRNLKNLSFIDAVGDGNSGTTSQVVKIRNPNDSAYTANALTAYNATTGWDISDRVTLSQSSRAKKASIYTYLSENTSEPVAFERFVQLNNSNANSTYGMRSMHFYQYDGSGTSGTDMRKPSGKLLTVHTYEAGNPQEQLSLNSDGDFSVAGGFTATTGGIHVADGVTFGQGDHFLGDEGGQNDSEVLVLRTGASASSAALKLIAGYGQGGDTSGKLQFYTNGSTSSPKLEIDIDGNIKMGSTQIISSGRNLTNIGTINSGAITSSGLLALTPTQSTIQLHSTGYRIKGGSGFGDIRIVAPRFRIYEDDETGTAEFQLNDGNAEFSGNVEMASFLSLGNATVEGTFTSEGLFTTDSKAQIEGIKSSATNPIATIKNKSSINTNGTYLDFVDHNDNFVCSIGTRPQDNTSNSFIIGGSGSYKTGLKFLNYTTYQAIYPATGDGATADDKIDLGASSARFDDIYATNGTIQTSDRNQKQDIQALTDAEQRVATACKGLIRRFRWQDSVAEKDDNSDSDETARYHFGVIAQDLQDAFTAEGLDASDYGMFISSTWEDDDGVEQTRLGVRYNELLSFIITTI